MSRYSLIGVDGNAFSIMAYVVQAMKACKMSKSDIASYKKEAMSGDYDNLIAVSNDMIDCCNHNYEDE